MTLEIVTAPAHEPISVEQAKDQLRVTAATEDAQIYWLIQAITKAGEIRTHRKFITQTVDIFLPAFPKVIRLDDTGKLQSVTTVKYTDTDGTQQTLDAAEYQVNQKTTPGEIKPAYLESWPSTRSDFNAVEIRADVGYGDAEDVPEPIRHWMILMVTHMFGAGRQPVITGTIFTEVPKTADWMLEPFIVRRF